MSETNSEPAVPEQPEPSTSQVKAAVRKMDTEDPFFYVVDLNVPAAALISPESVVDKFRSSKEAHARAKELNERVV